LRALTGEFDAVESDPDVDAVIEEIKQAMLEEQERLERIAEA